MSKSLKGPIAMAVWFGALAAFDFALAVIYGAWIGYPCGALMVAALLMSLREIKQRKARQVVAKDQWTQSIQFHNGGVVGPPDISRYLAQARASTTSFTNSTNPMPAPPAKKEPEPFHGLPFEFAVGEVYGLRMWHMDQYGRLRARNWEGAPPWRPGVNVAKCVKRGMDQRYSLASSSWPLIAGPYTWSVQDDPGHDVPSEDCSCGFYAYTDNLHAEVKSYARNGEEPVLGIIKGAGRTLIGTQGFRCEKAEIVAFRDPTRGGAKDDPWRTRQLAYLRRVYPDVPILDNRSALLEFAPLTSTLPEPSSDEFWGLP